jgi:putative sterol carrier protein
MATEKEVKEALNRIAKKLDDPKLKESFKAFNKTMQFRFKDLDLNYYMVFGEGSAKEIKEGTLEKPDVYVDMDSDTFVGIQKKEINAINAYTAGKIKVKGNMSDLLKLQKLL